MKRRVIIGLGIGLVIIVVGIVIWLFSPTTVGIPMPYLYPFGCLHHVYEDTNGNGRLDPGEKTIDAVTGLQIQIDDPDGPYSGIYSISDCHFDGTKTARTLHLHIIVPPGYSATSPTDIEVWADAEPGFEDYPAPPRDLFLRPTSGG